MNEQLAEQDKIVQAMITTAEQGNKTFSKERVMELARKIAAEIMADVIDEEPEKVASSSHVTALLAGKHYLAGETDSECYLVWLTQAGGRITVRNQKYSWPAGMR